MQPQNPFTILLAGRLVDTPRVRSQTAGTRVIAADAGIRHARTLGLSPELWVGDFDSASDEDGNGFAEVPRQTHTPAKDTTDGALAIEEALKRGADALTIVGAFGGLTDHTFAIMAEASALSEQLESVLLTSGDEEGWPMRPEPQSPDYTPGTPFSVLAFSDLKGLTLEGAVWPLDAITMDFGDTLTISNEVKTKLTARLTEGRALLVARLVSKTG
ncbi:MAG: thiamine diphosphokinase [Cohaesibacteraceae bacterium]